MNRSDRIPCVNPRCRRTAPANKYAPGTQIICGKCFRALPLALKERRRQLEHRLRSVRRTVARKFVGAIDSGSSRAVRSVEVQLNRQWDEMKQYLCAPARPVGLDGFLQEVGLA